MKKNLFFLSLAMGLAAVSTAQPEPIQTTMDYGLKGPVKRVTRITQRNVGGEDLRYYSNTLEFDRQGRLSNGYAYDGKGRLAVSGDTYYAYDPNGRLMSEQSKYGYIEYNYDKNGRLQSCVSYEKDDDNAWIVNCVKTYKYDKRGRLLGAEATRGDKKNPKLLFSYLVVYAVGDVPKYYIFKHMSEPELDDYGEVVKAAGMVVDTLPYNEWTTYNVNHGISNAGPDPDLRQYTKFDSYGNGVEWDQCDTLRIEDEIDDYGEIVKEGRDTVIKHPETRSIEYYDSYEFTISLPEMDVVYLGIENPFKVVVNGVSDEQVIVGDDDDDESYHVDKWKGQYTITPFKTGTLRVPVKVVEDNKLKTVGYQEFRVKKIPDPKIYIGYYPSGSVIPREELASIKGVTVRYGDEFCFRMNPPVVEKQTIDIFRLKLVDAENMGEKWNPEILHYISKMKSGYKLVIVARFVLPDGTKRVIEGSWTVAE